MDQEALYERYVDQARGAYVAIGRAETARCDGRPESLPCLLDDAINHYASALHSGFAAAQTHELAQRISMELCLLDRIIGLHTQELLDAAERLLEGDLAP